MVLVLAACATPAFAGDVEPSLRLDHLTGSREIALTFDACSGETDHRILDTLVAEHIPATVFVTGRWLKRNGPALAVMLAHPDLFEIENHGAEHVPAVTDKPTVFGLPSAGTLEAVRAEVDGGALAIFAATGTAPHWFRGATARYSRDAVALVTSEGYRIAGYSLNADVGASLPAAAVEKRLAAAKDGDVVIAHINQPHRPAGAGVAAGILALKRAGATFVRLEDADEAEGKVNAAKPSSHPSS
ncbi:polysaccharide deacetylase family protein [Aureimonas leprariae]|uniref:polysaccharide deacetylase family protein n=1 Tax=Plantimonas leprariae TaxID=2615207 RepID=UPI003CCE1798